MIQSAVATNSQLQRIQKCLNVLVQFGEQLIELIDLIQAVAQFAHAFIILAGSLAEGASLSEALREVEQVIAKADLPAGVSLLPSTAQQSNRELQQAVLLLGALAIFLVFIVMAVQYDSLVDPLVILFAIPLALAGAVFGLWVTGTALGATVLIGVVLRAYRWAALTFIPASAGGLVLTALVVGLALLCGLSTLHLAHYTLRAWRGRAPALGACIAVGESAASLALIAVGQERLARATATFADWPEEAFGILYSRVLVVSLYALALAAVAVVLRRADLANTVAELKEGWHFIFLNHTVRAVNVGLATGLIGGGMLIPLGAVYAVDVLDAGDGVGYGLFTTALGFGVASSHVYAGSAKQRVCDH